MGVLSNIQNRLRKAFKDDKEQAAAAFARGGGRSAPSAEYGLLQQYGAAAVNAYLRLDHDLMSRYAEYEEMDDYPEIAAALDVLADDASQPDTALQRTVWVTSSDSTVQENLDDLLHRTLRMDEEIWDMARTLSKYGNDFEELLITGDGVVGLNFLPAATVRRVEGERGQLFGFLQDFRGKFGYSAEEFQRILANRRGNPEGNPDKVTAFEDWEVVHFRLRGKQRRSVYGHSILEPGRWIWKRLMLLEDAALLYRLQRAPERYAFYVDVGDLPPPEALAFVNKVRQQFRKKKFINPATGRLDMKFDPLAQDEDFFIPSRKGGDGTRIETLGSPSWQSMDDVEYFQNKLYAAIKVPKAYLGQEDGAARAVLSSLDVRFARTVLRIQRELKNGLRKVCRVHLAAQNLDPADVEYDLNMTVPSAIFELAQLEVRNARADLASRMKEFVSLHWTLANVFGMTEEEIKLVVSERGDDVLRDNTDLAKAQAAGNKIFPGFGGGMGGMPPMDGGAPGGEPPPEGGGGKSPPDNGEDDAEDEQEQEARRNAGPVLTSGRWTRQRYVRPITERELFAGSRDADKRAGDKLEKLLKNDAELAARLYEVRELLQDIRSVSRASASRLTHSTRVTHSIGRFRK